ncbi:MAG: DNA translocase FtsK 4TM domain-containing protein [Elusimicrobiota bacterium]
MFALRKSAKRAKKKGGSKLLHAARWLAVLFCTIFLIWSLFVPESSGQVGQAVNGALNGFLGGASLLLPLLLIYGLFWYFRNEDAKGLISLAAGAVLLELSAVLFLGLLGRVISGGADAARMGGEAGRALAGVLASSIGFFGGFFVALCIALLGVQILFDISWIPLLKKTLKTFSDDYRSWRATRREFKDMLAEAAKKHIAAKAAAAPRIIPAPEAAKHKEAIPAAEPEPADKTRVPAAVKELPASPPPPKREEAVRGAEPLPGDKPFKLPPLDILQAVNSQAEAGRPSEAEIQAAVLSLETALANFKIDAKVTGVSPGPVITRYEVRPAPGVKVSTITARENDIALAMEARSIRMIAPIPGMPAIGIEVPNQRPAIVTLRHILESDAMPKKGAPLAFALGLSSEGQPLTADVQTMPHILIAGTTNSGKSVMVHSLIASILFRQRPDQVKFVLIDPKRVELSRYEGIPHLYDPKLPPSEVQVITTPKKAAAALKSLTLVMEDRLEKYQVWKVQDIRQFNQLAAKRGEKGDFYIVVVIDELADLMLVARDVVEDSVQRLTQMARAVGIHLVISTQRPSVDVVTGIIKANLPTRVAMRVTGQVNSKVILDGKGAESLLGRGDALYMNAGMTPVRIQGSFVDTAEIAKLVEYLKGQGKPDYPLLDGMVAPVGEARLAEFGVEPLHFTKALILVLKRRRVSQDLLKSQFGSSARATNILSVLESMEFIHKPEGTNRWTIHFERIEDHLRKHYPQINLDKEGI